MSKEDNPTESRMRTANNALLLVFTIFGLIAGSVYPYNFQWFGPPGDVLASMVIYATFPWLTYHFLKLLPSMET